MIEDPIHFGKHPVEDNQRPLVNVITLTSHHQLFRAFLD